MSYVVEVTYSPNWYVNAWCDVYYAKGATLHELPFADGWNHAYPDYVYNWGGIDGPATVTFPDEQSYTWFVLKWS